jgi:hypothetical protein
VNLVLFIITIGVSRRLSVFLMVIHRVPRQYLNQISVLSKDPTTVLAVLGRAIYGVILPKDVSEHLILPVRIRFILRVSAQQRSVHSPNV